MYAIYWFGHEFNLLLILTHQNMLEFFKDLICLEEEQSKYVLQNLSLMSKRTMENIGKTYKIIRIYFLKNGNRLI